MFFELMVIVIKTSIIGLSLVAAFVVETFRKRFINHSCQLQSHPIFEDPNSLKQVECPNVNDPCRKDISLIIPAFNELRLPAALDETINYLQHPSRKDQSFSYEVIIVDDGSKDRTKRVAFDFVRKYKVDNVGVILQRKNHGKGEAITKKGELLLMLDANGATKVDDLEKLENQIFTVAKTKGWVASDLSKGIADIPILAFGSRAHLEKKALTTRKWYRNFLMKGFHLVVLLAVGPGVRDTQCGFKMFTRAAARKLFTNIRLKSYGLNRTHIDPFIMNWSEIPGSKVSPLSILSMLWELALMSLGYRIGIWNITSQAT